MKTIIKKYFYIPFLALFLSGCNNDLTEITYSDVATSTYTFAEPYGAMGIVYAKMRNDFSHTDWYIVQESSSDEICHPANASGWDDGGIYKRMHLHTWNSENVQMNNMWNNIYSGVLNANRVIGQLKSGQIPTVTGVTSSSLISEMKVTRALYFWLLMDNFGDVSLDTATTASAISNPTMLPKTLRKDIYSFVVSEISQAIPNLSVEKNQLMYGRINKWAAKTLLANIFLNAKVYINEPKWTECLAQCEDVIASGKYILEDNYKANFITENQTSKENVFVVPFDEKVGTGFFPQMFSWNGNFQAKVDMKATPWGFGAVMGVPQFIDTYDPADTRLNDTWLIGQQYKLNGDKIKASDNTDFILKNSLPDGLYTYEKEGLRMNKFEVKVGALSNLGNDFPLFRYAQVLMMKAECLLRTGNADGAAEIVSQVRQRSFKSNPGKAIVTGAQLLGNSKYKYGYVENYNIIAPGDQNVVQFGGLLDELGWEFAWEGHRRMDNIRFGVFTTKSWLSHKPNGDFRTVFPIPQPALNANTLLKQNPAYVQ
jgi:hypothetical protein